MKIVALKAQKNMKITRNRDEVARLVLTALATQGIDELINKLSYLSLDILQLAEGPVTSIDIDEQKLFTKIQKDCKQTVTGIRSAKLNPNGNIEVDYDYTYTDREGVERHSWNSTTIYKESFKELV